MGFNLLNTRTCSTCPMGFPFFSAPTRPQQRFNLVISEGLFRWFCKSSMTASAVKEAPYLTFHARVGTMLFVCSHTSLDRQGTRPASRRISIHLTVLHENGGLSPLISLRRLEIKTSESALTVFYVKSAILILASCVALMELTK